MLLGNEHITKIFTASCMTNFMLPDTVNSYHIYTALL